MCNTEAGFIDNFSPDMKVKNVKDNPMRKTYEVPLYEKETGFHKNNYKMFKPEDYIKDLVSAYVAKNRPSSIFTDSFDKGWPSLDQLMKLYPPDGNKKKSAEVRKTIMAQQ